MTFTYIYPTYGQTPHVQISNKETGSISHLKSRRDMKSGMVVCLIATLAMFLLMSESGESLTCGEAVNPLIPCLPYVTGTTPQPSTVCCQGVKHLNEIASTSEIRREACKCIKNAASGMPNLKDSCVEDLPSKCGTTLPIRISKDIDCNT